MDAPIRALTRRVLRDDVKDFLISSIVSGKLKAGDRIVETKVAEELGVSQAPVREALRDLEIYGLVESVAFKGTRVCNIKQSDLKDTFKIRAALEGVAAGIAAERAGVSLGPAMQASLEAMREAARLGDAHLFNVNDIDFHRKVVTATGSRLLIRLWESMSLATPTFFTVAISPDRLSELGERHVPIIDAIISGDTERSERCMREHIEELGERIPSEQ